ncbi:unnamed protein product [Protopolystoma xenopodis]|uniref:Uncharacterized protein n=1 Tax=Protopolystoma xenopodis TaxID=117903 RepID=A0A3S4ZWL9_9PLAT|nr:unnamed protein product [Protopolystoma xenopodis]
MLAIASGSASDASQLVSSESSGRVRTLDFGGDWTIVDSAGETDTEVPIDDTSSTSYARSEDTNIGGDHDVDKEANIEGSSQIGKLPLSSLSSLSSDGIESDYLKRLKCLLNSLDECLAPRDLASLIGQLRLDELIRLAGLDPKPVKLEGIPSAGIMTYLAFANRLLGIMETASEQFDGYSTERLHACNPGGWRFLVKRLIYLLE